MTTTVTVQVGANKVLVTGRKVTEGEEGHNIDEEKILLEHRDRFTTFYVHGNNSLIIKELDEPSLIEEPDEEWTAEDDPTNNADNIDRTNNAG